MNNARIGTLAILSAFVLAVAYVDMPRDRLVFNKTRSVPVGIYRAVAQEKAVYVRFCLSRDAAHHAFYSSYCSPDNPDGPRILKRIHRIENNGDMLVRGDHPRAIDSRFIGHISISQQRGYWHPFITLNKEGFDMQNDTKAVCFEQATRKVGQHANQVPKC